MKQQLPQRVKVAGIDYKVEEKPLIILDGELGYRGACDSTTLTMEILDDMPWQRKKATFIHELLHAIMFEAGMREHDEELIDRMVPVLTQVLSNNDFNWMRE